ncbi:hypothetical protein KA013_00525 [Patescibacteria group bacterium]|nr:hypothetical protein [Patescibacteria group bacterium]
MQVNISQYGDNCAIVSTTNLCNQDLNLTFDAYTAPTSLPIKLQNNEAGTNILQVTTCQNSVCAQHDLMLHIASAPLSRLALTLPGDVVVK